MELFQRERYAEAIQLFDQSLCINERFLSPSALGLCTNLNNLASAYDKLGQRAAAIYFYERAVCVLNHPSAVWDEQRRRARDHVMAKLGRLTRASDATATEDEANLAHVHRIAAVMWEEGLKHYAADRSKEALVLFEHVLTFNRKFRPADAAVLATTLNNIGAAHEKCGNMAEAISYFRSAVDTLEQSTLPGKETRVAHVRNRLQALQESLGMEPHPNSPSTVPSAEAASATGLARPPEVHPGAAAVQPPQSHRPHMVSVPSPAAPPSVDRERDARAAAGAYRGHQRSAAEDEPLSNDREVAE